MAGNVKGKVISIDMNNGISRFSLLELLVSSESEFLGLKGVVAGLTYNNRFNHSHAEYLFPSEEIAMKFADILAKKKVHYDIKDAGPEHYSLSPNRESTH